MGTFLANSQQSMIKKKVVIAVGGSSGAIYAKVLLDKLAAMPDQLQAVGVVMSNNAKHNWKLELGNETYREYPFDFYQKMDFMAPFASGSAKYDTICKVVNTVPDQK